MELALVEYVQGPPPDRWHWCKNCPQYPLKVYKKRLKKPRHDLCDQCKRMERKKTCKV